MMTTRAWSFGDDRQVSATAMITTRAVPALLPAHHRRVAELTSPRKTLPSPCLPGTGIMNVSVVADLRIASRADDPLRCGYGAVAGSARAYRRWS
jgi:hypothetical protein